MKFNEDFLARMREATQLLQTSGPAAATAAIQRALQAEGGTVKDNPSPSDRLVDINPIPKKANAPSCKSKQGMPEPGAFLDRLRDRLSDMSWANARAGQPVQDVEPAPEGQDAAPGKFLSGSCTNRAGTRAYRLYVPAGYQGNEGEALPLVVMLHGCKQNPEDFAAGTGMNRVAENNCCLVLYPAQARASNGSNCWNWFNAQDQQRDAGEPSIIADMTREIMRDYRIDPDRVYVAGLSAGAAMACILAAEYPELYAAVGMHSGLPAGSAQDVASAFGAMKEGCKPASLRPHRRAVPAVVFHGDRDRTVHPKNGMEALAQCTGAGRGRDGSPEPRVVQGKTPQGRPYTRTIHYDAQGNSIAEHWLVHGAGHAWSGGSRRGSYTDPKGPAASAEMLRFFYEHPRRSG